MRLDSLAGQHAIPQTSGGSPPRPPARSRLIPPRSRTPRPLVTPRPGAAPRSGRSSSTAAAGRAVVHSRPTGLRRPGPPAVGSTVRVMTSAPGPADHPRRAAARRPAAARRGRRRHARRRARQHGARCAAGRPRPSCWSAPTWPTSWPRTGPPRRDAGARRRRTARRGRAVPQRAGRRVPPTWSSCRRPTPGWSSCSPTRPTAASAGPAPSGWSAGSGGVGATTFACALALTAPPRTARRPRRPRPARARGGPGGRPRRGRSTARGARWDVLVGSHGRLGSRSLRAALPAKDGLAVLTWAPGPPVPLDAGVGPRGALGRAARPRPGGRRPAPGGRRRGRRGRVARCDRVLVVVEPTVAGVAVRGQGRWRRCAAQRETGRGGPDGAGRPSPPTTSPTSSSCRCSRRCRTQRRLAEHLDLGLGPVHGRRSPLGPGSPGRPRGAGRADLTRSVA